MDQSNPRLLGSEGWEIAMWTSLILDCWVRGVGACYMNQSNPRLPGSEGWELATWTSLILDCWVQRGGRLLCGPV